MDRDAIVNMLRMQHRMNTRVHEDWIAQRFEWYRATWIECGELMDHVGYKWWKKQTPDMEQVRLEVVDIWHFGMSALFEPGIDIEALADRIHVEFAEALPDQRADQPVVTRIQRATESLAEDGGGALDPPSRRCSNASSSSNISTAFKETPPVLLLFAEETSAVRNGFKVFPRLLDFPGEAFVTSPKTVLVFLEFVSLFINFFFEEADESFFFSFFNAPILLYITCVCLERARKSKNLFC